MAKSYAQLTKQIATLQAEADKLRRAEEVRGVISRINDAIAVYGLKASDFKFGGAVAKAKPIAKYADNAGNAWGGFGPQPKWLREAIAAGRDLESFLTTATVPPKAASPAAKKKLVAKYRDMTTGSTWTGRGSHPVWLRTAIEAGKKLEDFAIAATKPAKKARPSQGIKRPKIAALNGAAPHAA